MLNSRSHQSPYPIEHVFVVQFETTTGLDAESLAGRVEHIESGQATRFQSMTVLIEFVAQALQEIQAPDHK